MLSYLSLLRSMFVSLLPSAFAFAERVVAPSNPVIEISMLTTLWSPDIKLGLHFRGRAPWVFGLALLGKGRHCIIHIMLLQPSLRAWYTGVHGKALFLLSSLLLLLHPAPTMSRTGCMPHGG